MSTVPVKLFFLLLMVSIGASLTSCLNSDEDNNEKDWLCAATVKTGGARPVFQMDEGLILTTSQNLAADSFKVGQRYFLQVCYGDTTNHPANTYPVVVKVYQPAVVKDYIVWAKDSADSWGNAPISNLYAWYSGHYFNTWFVSFASESKTSTFELIRDLNKTSATSTDTVPELFFSFRHNTSSYSTDMSFSRTISYNLNSLKTEYPNAKRFLITVVWKDIVRGTDDFTLTYYPDLMVQDFDAQASVLSGVYNAHGKRSQLNQ